MSKKTFFELPSTLLKQISGGAAKPTPQPKPRPRPEPQPFGYVPWFD